MYDHTLYCGGKHFCFYCLQDFSKGEILKHIKDYDSHLIIQELGKFNIQINVLPNGLEKYMSFTISNKLIFRDSFQSLSCALVA